MMLCHESYCTYTVFYGLKRRENTYEFDRSLTGETEVIFQKMLVSEKYCWHVFLRMSARLIELRPN